MSNLQGKFEGHKGKKELKFVGEVFFLSKKHKSLHIARLDQSHNTTDALIHHCTFLPVVSCLNQKKVPKYEQI